MDRRRLLLTVLGTALVGAYAADLFRHGFGSVWHLAFLIVFVAPKLTGAQFGVDLDMQSRKGTRDFLTRFRGMSEAQADSEIARTRDIVWCVFAVVLIAVESVFAFGAFASPVRA